MTAIVKTFVEAYIDLKHFTLYEPFHTFTLYYIMDACFKWGLCIIYVMWGLFLLQVIIPAPFKPCKSAFHKASLFLKISHKASSFLRVLPKGAVCTWSYRSKYRYCHWSASMSPLHHKWRFINYTLVRVLETCLSKVILLQFRPINHCRGWPEKFHLFPHSGAVVILGSLPFTMEPQWANASLLVCSSWRVK